MRAEDGLGQRVPQDGSRRISRGPVLGISVDKLDDQEKFTEKEKLTVPLLADPDKKVATDYGALGNSGFANRIQGMNPSLSADPRLPIPAGTILRLPGDAQVDAADKP